jgi:hypothetical protein
MNSPEINAAAKPEAQSEYVVDDRWLVYQKIFIRNAATQNSLGGQGVICFVDVYVVIKKRGKSEQNNNQDDS